MRAERVILHGATPVVVHHLGALLLRADAIHPVILVGEATARPTKHWHLQGFQGIEHIRAIPLLVGDLRLFSHPKASIDAGAEMLGELSVNLLRNNFSRLIAMQCDGLRFYRQ